MYRAVYNGRYKSTLLKTGRQVAKSTSLANFIITESVAIPFFKSYYVSPTKEQTVLFSNTRVGKTLSYSPLVRKHFQSPEHADRVLHRSYTNGSENGFTYASDNADRARGFSSDRVCYDEFQDMLFDEVVPVINATMKGSKYRFETYAGTPKTMEASIEYLWEHSTQSEWVMKCSGCGKYNFVVSVKSLGKHGPICLNCGKVLNPREGFWVDMRKSTGGEALVKGFHIPQPIMPSNIPSCYTDPEDQEQAQSKWDDILRDMELYSEAKFKNEVLGLSDSIGQRLISLEELEALCVGGPLSDLPDPRGNIQGITQLVAGVDWSGGGASGVSRTVLWIWGWSPRERRLRTVYYKIFAGSNPVHTVEEIAALCNRFGVSLVMGDAGEGHLANATLREKLGRHRVTSARYAMQAKPIVWNGVDLYMLDRTTVIDNYMMRLKRKEVTFPALQDTREPIRDILNVYEEVTTSGRKVWRHAPKQPDDCLHAQIYGWIAWKIVSGDLNFY